MFEKILFKGINLFMDEISNVCQKKIYLFHFFCE